MKKYKELRKEQERLDEKFFNGQKMKKLGNDIKHQAEKMDNSRTILNRVKDRFSKDYQAYTEPHEWDYTKGMNKDEQGLVRLLLRYFKESTMLGKYIDINKVNKQLMPMVTHKENWV